MKMTKKQFRIGELADRLQVKRFVIRFWEKEFELSASRSTGKQRFYTEEDYTTFSTIKQLLYSEKFTISGAKKQLSAEKCIPSTRVATARSTTARAPQCVAREHATPQHLLPPYITHKLWPLKKMFLNIMLLRIWTHTSQLLPIR